MAPLATSHTPDRDIHGGRVVRLKLSEKSCACAHGTRKAKYMEMTVSVFIEVVKSLRPLSSWIVFAALM
jgi:hypothetical protein